jgi:hypothetical protein
VSFVAPVSPVIFFLFLPIFGDKQAKIPVVVKLRDGQYRGLAVLSIEGAGELKFYLFALGEHEGFGAFEGALVFIAFDAVHALEAECLAAATVAGVGFLGDIVADCAFVLFGLLG